MEGSLAGKVAVITGGASGIGRALAEAMLAEGMQVMIADIEAGRLEQAATELGVTGVPTDVSDPDQVAALAGRAVAQFGTVHIMCNNAGIGPMAPVVDLTLRDWQWMIDVNIKGVVHGITHFLPILRANPEGGHFLNTGSMASMMPVPTLATYCTAKYGVLGLSEVLAMEMATAGEKIGVTVLCPGPVQTDLGSSTRNRPAHLAGNLSDVLLEDSEQFKEAAVDWISPARAARIALDAIRRGDLYAITHPGMWPEVAARQDAIARAFADEAKRREMQA
ncbi:SDR family NAD(P)-dependent oxidoreductase [Sphingobium nicotianae]|uniref:SDR family NAD(P)-dependent oxidoreductase n=1 Tax=Sphingobium nicotianae TaxID=2782607 RepID=A0A9X1DCA5_9SPHN|nr:SDR family NAD(P)-dependent oxidoreductase [Sphingobium nicotianae]MBT2187342.1 SDR family NAD(P)-dependent oxidoreductase [Sphingobium nicotianae]